MTHQYPGPSGPSFGANAAAASLAALLPTKPDARQLLAWVAALVSAPAMVQLATASGWPPPDSADPVGSLRRLAGLSTDWDFRAGAERHILTSIPAVVAGNVLDEQFVGDAAVALGLAGGMPFSDQPTHLVVLSGQVRACANRTAFAAELADVHDIGRITLVTSHRSLAAAETAEADARGWGPLTSEPAAAEAALRAVFRLGEPDADAGTRAVMTGEAMARQAWRQATWHGDRTISLVVAPTSDPGRRANTADQLDFWADLFKPRNSDRLVLVTTEHYVPYQQLAALGSRAAGDGAQITTTGTVWQPSGPYRATSYLQELRAALLAAVRLVDAVN